MLAVNRYNVARCMDQYRLHVRRFAHGSWPEADGHTEAIPFNRCFIPLSNPSGAECYLKDDKTHFTLTPGHAYFIPLNYPVQLRLDENLVFVSAQFSLEIHAGIDVFSAVKNIYELPGDHWMKFSKSAYDCKNVHLAAAMLYAILFEFSSILMQKMTKQEWDPVSKFSPFLQELNFIHSGKKKLARITVEDLAAVQTLSREYFTRSFTKATGITPKKFLTDLLITETKRLLLENEERSIKEIAEKLGFSSEFYFSKFCSKHFNLSPRQYREKNL